MVDVLESAPGGGGGAAPGGERPGLRVGAVVRLETAAAPPTPAHRAADRRAPVVEPYRGADDRQDHQEAHHYRVVLRHRGAVAVTARARGYGPGAHRYRFTWKFNGF